MIHYGQFCPVAKAAEMLGERWTLLIIRELLLGVTRFAELQRSLAKASPTILTKRLKELENLGIVKRRRIRGQRHYEYKLTRSGLALGPLIEQLGTWSAHWARGRLARNDLDEYFLMLDVSRRLVVGKLPRDTVTIGFRFTSRRGHSNWWLNVRDGVVDICDTDPGFDVDLLIATSLRALTEVWLGRTPLPEAVGARRVRLAGDAALERSVGEWLGFSAYA